MKYRRYVVYLFLALVLIQLALYVAHPVRMTNVTAAQARWTLIVSEVCPIEIELWTKK